MVASAKAYLNALHCWGGGGGLFLWGFSATARRPGGPCSPLSPRPGNPGVPPGGCEPGRTDCCCAASTCTSPEGRWPKGGVLKIEPGQRQAAGAGHAAQSGRHRYPAQRQSRPSEDSVNGSAGAAAQERHPWRPSLPGLNRPEGIAVAKDTTDLHRRNRYRARAGLQERRAQHFAVDDLDEPDQVELALDGALWIGKTPSPEGCCGFKDGIPRNCARGLLAPHRASPSVPNGAVYVAVQGVIAFCCSSASKTEFVTPCRPRLCLRHESGRTAAPAVSRGHGY